MTQIGNQKTITLKQLLQTIIYYNYNYLQKQYKLHKIINYVQEFERKYEYNTERNGKFTYIHILAQTF